MDFFHGYNGNPRYVLLKEFTLRSEIYAKIDKRKRRVDELGITLVQPLLMTYLNLNQ